MQKTKFNLKEYLQGNSLPILLQILGVLVLLLNLWIASRLSPIVQDLAVITTEVRANVEKDEKDHSTFVTKDTFTEVVTRLDHISNRVDSIYNAVLSR